MTQIEKAVDHIRKYGPITDRDARLTWPFWNSRLAQKLVRRGSLRLTQINDLRAYEYVQQYTPYVIEDPEGKMVRAAITLLTRRGYTVSRP